MIGKELTKTEKNILLFALVAAHDDVMQFLTKRDGRDPKIAESYLQDLEIKLELS